MTAKRQALHQSQSVPPATMSEEAQQPASSIGGTYHVGHWLLLFLRSLTVFHYSFTGYSNNLEKQNGFVKTSVHWRRGGGVKLCFEMVSCVMANGNAR